ncbi:OLC1v1034081C1 [Oldenlandia corymbosa var. corymbosa]|uniref:OLC1v1034081C1 n=1 Tax=Oldenlandia corymbosa var. corymbosa TaxID=529605 RepID=A0AAV1CQI1_OLDCO|nr:OLC1v1034081C1 [Oldenlandia corymbosa var. corymbosa]
MADNIINNQNQQPDLVTEMELWKFLPSDIFPLDQQPPPEVRPIQNRPNNSNFGYHHSASCMAGQQKHQGFTSYSFHGRGPPHPPPRRFNLGPPPPPPNFQMLRMADHRPFRGPSPEGCFCVSGGCRIGANPVYQQGAGTVWPGYRPGNPVKNRNPVQIQAECFMAERARALQAMQYSSWMNRVTTTRVFPKGSDGAGGGGIGFLGGTGVYLPRIPDNVSSTPANRGRKQGARMGQENGESQKKKKEDCRSQEASAELEEGLPEEWTY